MIVRRLYGISGIVTVDFELSNSHPFYTRLEYINGRLTFADNEVEKIISGKVFKRHYTEENDELSTFILSLYNPSMNAELGANSKMLINYYDDDINMNDAYYTEVLLNSTPNIAREHMLKIGWTNTLHISSYHTKTLAKISGGDLFIARLQNIDGT